MAARARTDGFVEPCIPTLAAKPPAGPDWVHEIKQDGYRLIVRRDGLAVRLFTRRGYDGTSLPTDTSGWLVPQPGPDDL
jgi:ATP-dependent DNA ligase